MFLEGEKAENMFVQGKHPDECDEVKGKGAVRVAFYNLTTATLNDHYNYMNYDGIDVAIENINETTSAQYTGSAVTCTIEGKGLDVTKHYTVLHSGQVSPEYTAAYAEGRGLADFGKWDKETENAIMEKINNITADYVQFMFFT